MSNKVAHTSHLKDKLASRYFPKPDIDVSDTKQARDAVYNWSLSEYHPIGTYAMVRSPWT